jgi:hypothetical protein
MVGFEGEETMSMKCEGPILGFNNISDERAQNLIQAAIVDLREGGVSSFWVGVDIVPIDSGASDAYPPFDYAALSTEWTTPQMLEFLRHGYAALFSETYGREITADDVWKAGKTAYDCRVAQIAELGHALLSSRMPAQGDVNYRIATHAELFEILFWSKPFHRACREACQGTFEVEGYTVPFASIGSVVPLLDGAKLVQASFECGKPPSRLPPPPEIGPTKREKEIKKVAAGEGEKDETNWPLIIGGSTVAAVFIWWLTTRK